MTASLPPAQPAGAADLGRPGTSRPEGRLPKSAPSGASVAPTAPVRVAEVPVPRAAEPTDVDIHVHVARSHPGAPVLASGGVDPAHLEAAAARVQAAIKGFTRSQPTHFPINH